MAENPHLRRLRYVLLSLAVALMATELAVCIFFPALWRRYLDVLGTRFGGPLASLMLMLVLALLVVALLWSNRKSSRLTAVCLIVSILLHMGALPIFGLWVIRQPNAPAQAQEPRYELASGLPSLVENELSETVRRDELRPEAPDERILDPKKAQPAPPPPVPPTAQTPAPEPSETPEREPAREPVEVAISPPEPEARVEETLAEPAQKPPELGEAMIAAMQPVETPAEPEQPSPRERDDLQIARIAPDSGPQAPERNAAPELQPVDRPPERQTLDPLAVSPDGRTPDERVAAPEFKTTLDRLAMQLAPLATPAEPAREPAASSLEPRAELAPTRPQQQPAAPAPEAPRAAPEGASDRMPQETLADRTPAALGNPASVPLATAAGQPDSAAALDKPLQLAWASVPLRVPEAGAAPEAPAAAPAPFEPTRAVVLPPAAAPSTARPDAALRTERRPADADSFAERRLDAVSPGQPATPRAGETQLQPAAADAGTLPVVDLAAQPAAVEAAGVGTLPAGETDAQRALEWSRAQGSAVAAAVASAKPLSPPTGASAALRNLPVTPFAVADPARGAASGGGAARPALRADERATGSAGPAALPLVPVAGQAVALQTGAAPAAAPAAPPAGREAWTVGRSAAGPVTTNATAARPVPGLAGRAPGDAPRGSMVGAAQISVPTRAGAASAGPRSETLVPAVVASAGAAVPAAGGPAHQTAPLPGAGAAGAGTGPQAADVRAGRAQIESGQASGGRIQGPGVASAPARTGRGTLAATDIGVLAGASAAPSHYDQSPWRQTASAAAAWAPIVMAARESNPDTHSDSGGGQGAGDAGAAGFQVSKASTSGSDAAGRPTAPAPAAAGGSVEARSSARVAIAVGPAAGQAGPGAAAAMAAASLPAAPRNSLLSAETHVQPGDLPEKLLYTLRSAEKRREHIAELGGSKETEDAVEAALRWLAAAQSDDGRWDVDAFKTLSACGGAGDQADGDSAITGLCLLAYLGAGYTHADGIHAQTIRKGLDWLIAGQKAEGDVRQGGQMYGQAMAAAALCEAYSLTGDERLRRPAELAAGFIMATQNPAAAWRYLPGDGDNDTSVAGWQILALKSARIAGVEVPERHFAWAGAWLDSVRKGEQGGLFSYKPGHGPTPVMTAEGWFCQLFMKGDSSARGATESAAYVMANPPVWDPSTPALIHFYYWYYATLSLYLSGSDQFERWNESLKAALLQGRTQEGPAAGSWDPVCQLGPRGGRLYTTAMATLCLEVYYRYLPFYRQAP